MSTDQIKHSDKHRLSQLHINIYDDNICYDSRFISYGLFTCIVFIVLSSQPPMLFCHLFYTTARLSSPADNFMAFFCTSLVSWTLIYCVSLSTNLFSVKLKPKGVLFSCLLSGFRFTLTENICCMLPLIPILLLEYSFFFCLFAECTRSAFVKATQTRMVPTGGMWVTSVFFLLS